MDDNNGKEQKGPPRKAINHPYRVPQSAWGHEELFRELEFENSNLSDLPYYNRLRGSFREFSDEGERLPRISIYNTLKERALDVGFSNQKKIVARNRRMSTEFNYTSRLVEKVALKTVITSELYKVFARSENPVKEDSFGIPFDERTREGMTVRRYYFPDGIREEVVGRGILRYDPIYTYEIYPLTNTALIREGFAGEERRIDMDEAYITSDDEDNIIGLPPVPVNLAKPVVDMVQYPAGIFVIRIPYGKCAEVPQSSEEDSVDGEEQGFRDVLVGSITHPIRSLEEIASYLKNRVAAPDDPETMAEAVAALEKLIGRTTVKLFYQRAVRHVVKLYPVSAKDLKAAYREKHKADKVEVDEDA